MNCGKSKTAEIETTESKPRKSRNACMSLILKAKSKLEKNIKLQEETNCYEEKDVKTVRE